MQCKTCHRGLLAGPIDTRVQYRRIDTDYSSDNANLWATEVTDAGSFCSDECLAEYLRIKLVNKK